MTSPTSPPAAPEMTEPTDAELAEKLRFLANTVSEYHYAKPILRLAASRLERRLTDEEAYLLWRQEQRP